jgi:hypothetical protein
VRRLLSRRIQVPSDDDRLAAQLRIIALLDRSIKGVHVDMDDLSQHQIATILFAVPVPFNIPQKGPKYERARSLEDSFIVVHRAFWAGTNSFSQAGQRTRSLSTLTKSMGAIEWPHSVQTVSKESCSFLRSSLVRHGMGEMLVLNEQPLLSVLVGHKTAPSHLRHWPRTFRHSEIA